MSCGKRMAFRGITQIRFQKPLKFDQRLIVKYDLIQIGDGDIRLLQAVGNGPARKTGIVFLAGEALFLSRCQNLTVAQESGCAVVIIG